MNRDLIAHARYELIPMKSAEAQLQHLPRGATVSVTCSPAKGIPATLELTSRLIDLGHIAVPHISARLVEDDIAVKAIAEFCRTKGLREIFVVAGDAPEPIGEYVGAVEFLREFLNADHGLQRIGVTAYPDGHALIDDQRLHQALHAKQALLADAGIAGFASTQMCFDAEKWRSWARAERDAGLTLPLHLGVPGVIDRVKLLTMGMRLGIGASLRYVQKNGGLLGRLLGFGGYDPRALIKTLGKQATELNIEGVHLFTFNNVEATARWQRRMLGGVSGEPAAPPVVDRDIGVQRPRSSLAP